MYKLNLPFAERDDCFDTCTVFYTVSFNLLPCFPIPLQANNIKRVILFPFYVISPGNTTKYIVLFLLQ